MDSTAIDHLYQEYTEIIKILDKSGEVSLRSTTQDNFRKTLLLATASFFEWRLTNDLIKFFKDNTDNNRICIEFIKNKAINRQYHTFFDWKSTNANQFFGLFGESFKTFILSQVQKDEKLNIAIKAFVELGNDRNYLVHGNYVSYSMEKTADEIYQKFKEATFFVEVFPMIMETFIKIKNT